VALTTVKTMIVDDNARFRELVMEYLTPHPYIEVVAQATTGGEAIALARALKPDLVLMDVRMPDMSGLDATRLLKAEMPAVRVIILTNYNLAAYRKAAVACGANGYVVKESMNEELWAAIEGVMQKGSQEKGQNG